MYKKTDTDGTLSYIHDQCIALHYLTNHFNPTSLKSRVSNLLSLILKQPAY